MRYKRCDDIIFTGFATGNLKEELLSNALCFVQPSTLEGMPLSLLEAMGYGRMILASDIQENKDVLAGHGLHFRVSSKADLLSKLMSICEMPKDVIQKEGKSARQFGRKTYDWEQITDKVESKLMGLF